MFYSQISIYPPLSLSILSSPTHSTGDRAPCTIGSIITSPTKSSAINLSTSPLNQRQRLAYPTGVTTTIISPVSNILSANGELAALSDDEHRSSKCNHKRRSVSATASATTLISITGKNARSARTTSSSALPVRSKSSTYIPNSKRSHSPSSVTLLGSNKNPSQRKKQKFSHYWALFGKSEQKLVSIDVSNSVECIVFKRYV